MGTIWEYGILFLSTFSLTIVIGTTPDESTKFHYTKAHYKLHQLVRRETHPHLEDFEIVLLEYYSEDHNPITDIYHNRKRRSLSSTENLKFFKVTSHGHEFHVELESNTKFLSPTFSVTKIKNDETTTEILEYKEIIDDEIINCHFVGKMISHENRSTSISTCNGLTGLLRTEEDDFIIEPVPDHLEHEFLESQQPHIIYKRKHLTTKKERLHFCGKQKRHPISTSIEDIAEIKELSDGERIIVRSKKKAIQEVVSEENGDHKRQKRNVIEKASKTRKERIVKTLVVADRQLIKNHEKDHVDVTTYVLTVMNMVASLFKDGTLDENISIVLVGIVLLEDDADLQLDHRADKSLMNFCRWQANFNTTNGRKPDHSILLTGLDICVDKNEPCDTLGLAQIGGMCTQSGSCTINEDMGLGLAFTVAHETGHSFGMKHDGQGNSCGKRDGHIMSSALNTLNGVFTWSSCSRKSMAQFFKTARSHCLDDGDNEFPNVTLPEKLPGEKYSANQQCKLQYGRSAKLCNSRYQNNMNLVCKLLWCRNEDGVCETKYMPAAEGTTCGMRRWCRRGVCVSKGSPPPKAINGGWSKFGPWSECSRTCGGGVSFRQRYCNNPMTMYGGRYCEGDEKIYEICNYQKCPPDALNFRAQQCATYNSQPYRRQYFSWIPFTKYWKYDFNKCALLCEADGLGFFDRLSPQVVDGTRCDGVSNDVCIAGQCVRVGCDFVVNSNSSVDACGVCNGDNSTCKFVNGSFTEQVPDSGYYPLVKIPEGARSIRIWENKCCTHTYIAARSPTDQSRYYLNGNWRVDLYGKMNFAGTSWKYEREGTKSETLYTDGPLTEDVLIEALIVQKNPGVSYTYTIKEMDNKLLHNNQQKPRHTYAWLEEFTPCSKSCAGGEQSSVLTCLEDNVHEVNDSYCEEVAPRPENRIKKCNTQLCPASWETGEWNSCSRTCGGGIQTRQVSCKRMTDDGPEYASTNECDLSKKPQRNQICSKEDCPPEWKTSRWSQCSRTCGRGVRTRTISCKSGMRKIPESNCKSKSKPIFRQHCLISYCRRRFQWLLSSWASCSVSCGEGQETRRLKCIFKDRVGQNKQVHARRCRHLRKPRSSMTRSCSLEICVASHNATDNSDITTKSVDGENNSTSVSSRRKSGNHRHKIKIETRGPTWVPSEWQKCTVTCDGGHQVRAVKCLSDGKTSIDCSFDEKPANTRICNTKDCSAVEEDPCVDSFKWCHLVPHHNTCSHAYFGKQCCKSCKKRSK
ncbi:A disintegrin and metalloproteinase with thrombospondin motifs 18-like isoform X1 [Styela clava]